MQDNIGISWNADCYEKNVCIKEEKQLVPELEYNLFVNDEYIKTFYCSPWNIDDLVYGDLYLHGQIEMADDVKTLTIDDDAREIYVRTRGDIFARANPFTSGDVIPAKKRAVKKSTSTLKVCPEDVYQLVKKLNDASVKFKLTGGVHSAMLSDGKEILYMREDVGRHNAMEKLLGAVLRNGVDTKEMIIVFSGRIAAEILEKAAIIGAAMVIAVSAPTDAASKIAEHYGMTLIGFARGESFNVYTTPQRVGIKK